MFCFVLLFFVLFEIDGLIVLFEIGVVVGFCLYFDWYLYLFCGEDDMVFGILDFVYGRFEVVFDSWVSGLFFVLCFLDVVWWVGIDFVFFDVGFEYDW